MTRILIAGGGIAGLTAALSLHAAGFDGITVAEAAREIQPLGAGLNIMPNAVRELDALGLLGRLDACAVRTRELRYYHRAGGLISREPRGLGAGYRWPQLSIHRGELQRVLADAVRERLGPDAVRSGVRVGGVETLPDGRARVLLAHRGGTGEDVPPGSAGSPGSPDSSVSSDFSDFSETVEPEVLIGADGIRSAVRAALNPAEGEPPWNGLLVWRGVSRVPADRVHTFMFIAGDDRQKAVVYPMTHPDGAEDADGSGGAEGYVLVNWALAMPAADIADAGRGDWNRPVPVAKFAHHYAGWEFDGVAVPEILAAAERAFEYPMVDREPLDRWTYGRTTLIGDAAHAMYPIGSNGATQSIVDARALAHAMATHPDRAEALRAYEAERRPAMTELQRANRRQGPEVVIGLAHARAPQGFTDIAEVIPPSELARIASRYAETGAFDPASVNAGSPYELPETTRR